MAEPKPKAKTPEQEFDEAIRELVRIIARAMAREDARAEEEALSKDRAAKE